MERIRDSRAVALTTVVDRLLKDRPHLAASAAAIEQARSSIADRAQEALSTALRQPALASLAARVPITAVSAAVVEVERHRRRQTLIRALILAGIATVLSLTVTAIIRRQRARRAPSTVPVDRAATVAPQKELVAIPIETSVAEPLAQEASAMEPIEAPGHGQHDLSARVTNEA
jgi:hypothetical protein